MPFVKILFGSRSLNASCVLANQSLSPGLRGGDTRLVVARVSYPSFTTFYSPARSSSRAPESLTADPNPLMTPTTLILIRHGETEWNRERRIQGHLDSALTPEGIAQAEACAKRIADEPIDVVVASDLGRVRRTVELLLAGRNLPITYDPSLRERCFGIGEGLTYAEMDGEYPQIFAKTSHVDAEFALPEGETRAAFHARVNAAFDRLTTTHAGKRLLVVAHGGVLGTIYRRLKHPPIAISERVLIPNVGYNRIALGPDGWKIEVWGDTSHLEVETTGGV